MTLLQLSIVTVTHVRLHACVEEKGRYYEHKLWQFSSQVKAASH